jgi:hypothetical protein
MKKGCISPQRRKGRKERIKVIVNHRDAEHSKNILNTVISTEERDLPCVRRFLPSVEMTIRLLHNKKLRHYDK